jgi:hypothetical protein
MNALFGSVLASLAVAGSALGYGTWRWRASTRALREQLEAARLPMAPATVDLREVDALPPAVRRYFRSVLADGQRFVRGARLRHRGHFNLSQTTERWKPFKSAQKVVTRRPGFDWDASVRLLPGMNVRVHDAYVAGVGVLHAAVFGLVTVAEVRGTPQLAEGELMRFLAEAVWYPTALLPSQGVVWRAVDARSARATIVDGDLSTSLLFGFDDEGLIETVSAEARGRMLGEQVVPTPWQGRFWNYETRAGMRLPLSGEVAWLSVAGALPYWRGRIDDIAYEFA